MKTARVGACLAIVLAWTITSPLFAQYPPSQPPMQSGEADTNDFFGPRNAQFRSDIGDGVGYAKGFQTFGLWQSFVASPNEWVFFANPRGIITYLGDVSANVGAGVRYYNEDTDRIFGGSFWYDHDNNGNRTYDQLGVSLEWLGNYFDVRANGYVPTNSGQDNLGSFYNGTTQFFQNFIGIGRSTIYNTPLEGGDFEIGGLLPGIGDIGVRPYVGGYYYQGENVTPAYGVKARIEALITQDFWGQILYSNDPLFGSNVMGAVTWYYGSGQAPRWFQRIPVQDRLHQQVERQYRIAVYEEVFNDTVLALRAGGTGGSGGPVGTPIFVVHVNNAAPAGGDGTVEHPLNYLPTTTAPNVDIVFVRRGTGTTTRYDQGITLNDYQRLLGDGIHHNFTSLAGTFALPGFTAGPLPTITNTTGDAVTLASFNEVSGFNIASSARHGIFGDGITDFNINNVNITNSGSSGPPPVGAGIELVNVSGSGQIFDSTMNGNNAEGIHVDNFGTALALSVNNVTATGNLTGISLDGAAGAVFAVSMNTVNTSSNKHDGIAVNLASASTFAGTFFGITSSNNNNPQVDLGFGNGFTANIDASTAVFDIENSTFNSNSLNGLSFVATNGSAVAIALVNNNSTISNNLLNGVFVDATDSAVDILLKNNVISGNGHIGVNLQATNGSLNLIAGSLVEGEGNLITSNHGAGIAYTLRDAATGTIDIRGNTITGTLDDTQSSTIYNGQAIDIRLDGSTNVASATAHLFNGVIDRNTIGSLTDSSLGNVGGGIIVFADQSTTLENLTIGNTDGNNENGNLIARNGGDGIHFLRRDQAVVDNIVIQDNIVRFNTGDGLEIEAHASPNDVNDYRIEDNIFANNTGRGVGFFLEADAQISANMFNNLITLNGNNGIQLTELVNSAFDLRFLTGVWQRNVITNNTGSGIVLSGATSGLLIGSVVNQADTNLINDNTLDGIEINGSGSVTIARNEIARNGSGGIDINANSFNNVTITRNYIHNNRNTNGDGDGIELLSEGPFSVIMTASLNTIVDNAGRGVDILNRARGLGSAVAGQTTVSLDTNVITGNRLEGVYVINTASGTQNQTDSSTTALAADGNINAAPRLTFNMNNNTVLGNGIGSTASTTGLILRVGSSDGNYGAFTDGGFASEGFGGVIATITNNTFHGNLGDDIYFDSYTSTDPPGNTTGTWDATTFTINSYQGDPLSRLDLTFTGNTFDSADVNGTTGLGGGTTNSAFYNNPEGDFKSRLNTATDPGPFASATRQRNAQRLAARLGLPPATPGGASNSFLYAGIGQSTFRLLGVPAPGNVVVFNPTGNTGTYVNPFFFGNGFIIDDTYVNQGSANGVFNVNAGADAMPYGWNVNGGATPRPQ